MLVYAQYYNKDENGNPVKADTTIVLDIFGNMESWVEETRLRGFGYSFACIMQGGYINGPKHLSNIFSL